MNKNRVPPGGQHPEEWRQDLNPNAMAGENAGPEADVAAHVRPLGEIKDAHSFLQHLTKDELHEIPVLREGERLEQGGTYIDLHEQRPREFTATGDMSATKQTWYVRKGSVHYEVWNRLIGVQEPARR